MVGANETRKIRLVRTSEKKHSCSRKVDNFEDGELKERSRVPVFLGDGSRERWDPVLVVGGESGQVYCPKKRGVVAEGRCIKWQRKLNCGLLCKNAIKDPNKLWKANPDAYFINNGTEESSGRRSYGKWETLKLTIKRNDGSVNAYEVLAVLGIESYEAAAMMLRYYEKKGLLERLNIKGLRPQRYRLTEQGLAYESKESDQNTATEECA